MKIVTSAPIFMPDPQNVGGQMAGYKNVGTDKDWVNAEGEEFIPFDGIPMEEMTGFIDNETGDVYYSANGEDFYNAKGEALKKVFGAIGKGLKTGLKKGAKAVGKGAKAVAKGIGKGIKAIGRLVKNIKAKRQERRAIRDSRVKEAPKGAKPTEKPVIPIQEPSPSAKAGANENPPTFVQPLPPATATTPPTAMVEVDGKKFSTESIPKEAKINVVEDPTTGQKLVGAEVPTDKLVAVQGADGKYDYYVEGDVKTSGMSSKTKLFLWIGVGVVVLGGILYFVTRKK